MSATIKQTCDLYLASFEQMRVVRWRSFSWMPRFRPMWFIRLFKEDDLQHCAGMATLFELILILARCENDLTILNLRHDVIRHKLWIHDSEESLIGDSRAKNKKYYALERSARAKILKFLRNLGRKDLAAALAEYPDKKTSEDRFVKVLDELQAFAFMLYVNKLSWSNRDIMNPYTIKGFKMAEEFPILQKFGDELVGRLQQRLGKTK